MSFLSHIPLPLVENALFIDNNFLEGFQTCPRATEYSKLRKRTLATARPALSFGSAGHLALDLRYKLCGADIVDDIAKADLEAQQVDLLQRYFIANPPPENDFRTLNWAIEIFVTRYNMRYAKEPFNLVNDADGKVFVERSFAVPFLAVSKNTYTIRPFVSFENVNVECEFIVVYIGRIDLPILKDNSIYIMDHKTSSQIGDSAWDTLRISPQQVGYAWAWYKSTGIMPLGFAVNLIRVKTQPAKPVGGLAKWWEESFSRNYEYLNPSDPFGEWEQNTTALIEEFLWHHQRSYFPMKKSWCVGKYGKCQFYNVCYSPFHDRLELLASQEYVDNNWSPLDPMIV